MNANDQTLSFNDPLAGIREDQIAAWAADAGLPAEEYLRRFPTLSNWDALALVAAEVVIRRERGENPELGEYQARFPHLAEDPSIRFGHLFDLTLTQAADKTGPPAPLGQEGALPVVPGYLLTEEIGRGGMGVVYRAEDSSLGRDVAVKILQFHNPASGFAARRFVEEGRITGQLQHPAIPPIHQIGALPDGRPFLAMKLIKGRTLATEAIRLMAIRGRLDEAYTRLEQCGADQELIALCKRCLSAEPEGRPRNAGEVARGVADLRAAAEERARRAERETAVTEARTLESRRRRAWQLTAAGIAALLLLGGVLFAWWQDRQAAAGRTEAIRRQSEDDRREEAERERLARNAEAIAALLDGCEQSLRDDDARRAAVPLEQAEARVSEGGADHLRPRLARCRADFDLLRELDRIGDLESTWLEGGFQTDKALAAMPEVLKGFRIELRTTPPAEAARIINESLIRDRLLAVVDWWFTLEPNPSDSKLLLAVLHEADPDPFRDSFRRASVAAVNLDLMRDLVRDLADTPEALQQPPRFAVVIGRCKAVSLSRREHLLRTVLFRQPGNFSVLMALANLYPFTDEGLADRLGWYRAAAVARPTNPMVWLHLGIAYFYRGDLYGAIDCYEQAIRVDSKYAIAYYDLGVCLARLGKRDEAISNFQTAIRLEPDHYLAHNNLGSELLKQGKSDAALVHFREALRLYPGYAIAQYNIAAALTQKGDVVGGALALQKALQTDSGREAAILAIDRMRKKWNILSPLEVAPPPRPLNR